MGLHVQQQVVLVLGLLVAHRTLELRVDAALEPDVSAQAVKSRVRVAAPGAGVRRRRVWSNGDGVLRHPLPVSVVMMSGRRRRRERVRPVASSCGKTGNKKKKK